VCIGVHSWLKIGLDGLNCNLFNGDFPASLRADPIPIPDANLRIFLSEVRPKLRSISVNARRTVPRMPEGALPVAEVGSRESETPAGHRRGSDLQGIGVLHHRLPKRFLQGSSQKGVSIDETRHCRKIRRFQGACENSFANSDQDTREKTSKRIRRVSLP
jgi:hypothetical protein